MKIQKINIKDDNIVELFVFCKTNLYVYSL